jgi:NAD(P)-dependent dehydrogenase (short-subunit alcohol dehydrogenase family)
MLLDTSPEEWDRVMGVNARGVWLAMRELARPMLAAERGSMVVTSSVSGTLSDKRVLLLSLAIRWCYPPLVTIPEHSKD